MSTPELTPEQMEQVEQLRKFLAASRDLYGLYKCENDGIHFTVVVKYGVRITPWLLVRMVTQFMRVMLAWMGKVVLE